MQPQIRGEYRFGRFRLSFEGRRYELFFYKTMQTNIKANCDIYIYNTFFVFTASKTTPTLIAPHCEQFYMTRGGVMSWQKADTSISHLVFNELFPKVTRIITNALRTTTSNLNAIQPTVITYLAHTLFGGYFFSKCPPSAIVFLENYAQKLIRSSEIPKEPRHNLNAIQPKVYSISCQQAFWVAIAENGRFWLGAPKIYMGRIAQTHRSCLCKIKKLIS